MNIVFRADASTIIGSGHVMRCLTLAEALRKAGHKIYFICRKYPGNLIEFIRKKSFVTYELPFTEEDAYVAQRFSNHYDKWLWVTQQQDASETQQQLEGVSVDFLIVDHYGLDKSWEQQLRKNAKKIFVIDDLANRAHDCHLLLDQNFYLDYKDRYNHLVPAECQKLLGLKYALLRQEFFLLHAQRKSFEKYPLHAIKKILIFMGGADPKNLTEDILRTLIQTGLISQYSFDVVVGLSNPFKDQIKRLCDAQESCQFYISPSNYGNLLAEADFAIGAGGSSVYERCVIGLPGVIFAFAENQVDVSRNLHQYGAQIYLDEVSQLSGVLHQLSEEKIMLMANKALNLFSDYVGIDGVIDAIQNS
jgi:UDP-2,4-diacetamido-2,4,6-trideoxy-beta-L-altropyranose hydrolase